MGILCCEKKKKTETFLDANDIEKNIDIKEDNPLGIKIKNEDFERLKLIGKGSFGDVFLVKLKSNEKIYAMKILDKEKIKSYDQEEHTKSERDLMVKINCPFIVDIKYAFQDKQYLYMVTEFMQGGEMFFHLFKEKRFTNEKAKFYLVEIILAIEFLHKNNMMYRDLKPENVLLDKNGHIKITDFGLSKILSKENEKTYTICGTPQYLAPEILSSEGYDNAVDWWSLGCLMYKMLIGIDAFKFSKNQSLSPEMYEIEILIPDYVTKEANDLIRKLLVINPKKRLGSGPGGADKIKNHSYFKDIDWEKAWNKELIPPFIPDIKDDLDLKYFDKGFTDENLESFSSEEESSSLKTIDYKGFTYVTDSYTKDELNDGRASNATLNSNSS